MKNQFLKVYTYCLVSNNDWFYVSKDYDNTIKIREGEKGFFLKKEMNLGGVIVKNSAYLPIQMHESILKGF